MKRSIWFWVYFIVAIVLAVYLATRTIMTGLGYGPAAQINTISISVDMRDRDLTELAAAAALPPGTNTYSTNLDTIAARTDAVPGIRQSAVRRHANGNLSVRARVYRGVALWTDGEFYYPLSADGTIVQTPNETRDPDIVMFRGKLPKNVGKITDAAQNMVADVDYLEWIEARRWNLVTRDGITVMLPEEDPVAAIGALIMLNKNHQILDKKLTYIDMRDPARILVR